jgi:FixJ family two-component response regulator
MPGMNGRVLAGQVATRRTLIKVVYMSGYTGQAVGAHGALEEGSFFLQKPFSRDGLVSKVPWHRLATLWLPVSRKDSGMGAARIVASKATLPRLR